MVYLRSALDHSKNSLRESPMQFELEVDYAGSHTGSPLHTRYQVGVWRYILTIGSDDALMAVGALVVVGGERVLAAVGRQDSATRAAISSRTAWTTIWRALLTHNMSARLSRSRSSMRSANRSTPSGSAH